MIVDAIHFDGSHTANVETLNMGHHASDVNNLDQALKTKSKPALRPRS